jgi:hypothetical protein
MSRHNVRPLDSVRWELGNRAPCVECGEGAVCCLRPGTDLRTWDGGTERLYWRHDRSRRVLVDEGDGRWEVAPDRDQYGPTALVYRLGMAEAGPTAQDPE